MKTITTSTHPRCHNADDDGRRISLSFIIKDLSFRFSNEKPTKLDFVFIRSFWNTPYYYSILDAMILAKDNAECW